jgi:hypothetical protein
MKVETPDLLGNSGITGDFGGHQVVWVDTKQKAADVIDTVIHESVHVFQHCMSHMGESHIGKETQAYSIAHIATTLLGELTRHLEEDNALHEGRETGLQAGECAVQLEASTNQSSIGENGYPEAS